MILGFTYLKEKETGEVKEITFADTSYINIDDASLRLIFGQFFKRLYCYIFQKHTFTRKELSGVIEMNATDIYEEHNRILSDANLPTIDYQKIFRKEEEKVPSYIM